MGKFWNLVRKVTQVSISQFVYYNFLCRKVHRKKQALLIPYRGSAIRIEKGAVLILEGRLILNAGLNGKHMRAKETCYLLIEENGILHIKERACIGYSSRLIVGKNGHMEIGSMGCNEGCVFVCLNSITLGNDVMMGWNVTIMDGDGHPVGYGEMEKREGTKPVVVGNHVWLCNGSQLMKGSKIGDGAIIGARSFITGRVKAGAMTSPMPSKIIMEDVGWKG